MNINKDINNNFKKKNKNIYNKYDYEQNQNQQQQQVQQFNQQQQQYQQYQQQQQQQSHSQSNTTTIQDYQQILNSLLQLKSQDTNQYIQNQWNRIPQVIILTLKALKLSMNNVQNKINKKLEENKYIINDIGLKVKYNQFKIQEMQNIIKNNKINQQRININNLSNNNIINNINNNKNNKLNGNLKHSQQYLSPSSLPLQQQVNLNQLFPVNNGLDIIMIQQVKTIADALISKKSNQMQQLYLNNNTKLIQSHKNQIIKLIQSQKQQQNKQLQKLRQQISHNLNIQINKLKVKSNQKDYLFTQLNQKVQNIIKQIYSQYSCVTKLGQYISNNILTKQQFIIYTQQQQQKMSNLNNQIYQLKSSLKQIHNQVNQNIINHQKYIQNNIDNKISIIKQQIYKDFSNTFQPHQLYKKINSQINQIVQNTINKKINKVQDKIQKQLKNHKQQINKYQISIKSIKKDIKNRSNDNYNDQKIQKSFQKSKISKKNSILPSRHNANSSSSQSISISSYDNQQKSLNKNKSLLVFNKKQKPNKIIDTKNKYSQQNNQYKSFQQQKQINQELSKKLTSKSILQSINKIVNNKIKQVKQQIDIHIKENVNNLQKRIQISQKQLCSLFQQKYSKINYSSLYNKDIKSEKKLQQLKNLKRSFIILANQNILIKCGTNQSCNKNQVIRWQKQHYNTLRQNFQLCSSSSLNIPKKLLSSQHLFDQIFIHSPGIYFINIIFFSAYLKKIYFHILINQHCIYTNQSQDYINQLSMNLKNNNYQHPSRGIGFNQYLLIPAKSKISIRMMEKFEIGQGFIQIRKVN